MPTSRRKVIKSIATAAMAAPIAAQHVHPSASHFVQISAAPAAYTPKFFTAAEFQQLSILVDMIIPRTDTPGAADAGVHRMIDLDLMQKPAGQNAWRQALAWFNTEAQRVAGTSFAEASAAQRIAILTEASASPSAPGWEFFSLAKSATVDGYYGTREGLRMELGWNANTYLPEFKGCTHKDHQS